MTPKLPGIACFFATSPEARWLKRQFKPKTRTWLTPATFDWGLLPPLVESSNPSPRNLLVVETGIGPKASERAARYALDHFPVEEVWIFGTAAATQKGLKPGDALLAEAVGDEETISDRDPGDWMPADQALLDRARRLLEPLSAPVHSGRLLTIGRIIHSPQEKLLLGEKFDCLGLEMEATPIVREAQRRRIPALQIRWISDGVDDSFPPIDSFIDELGRLRPLAPFFGLLKNPRLFLEIPPFLWNVRAALSAQNRFLQKWLEDERISPSIQPDLPKRSGAEGEAP